MEEVSFAGCDGQMEGQGRAQLTAEAAAAPDPWAWDAAQKKATRDKKPKTA